MTPEQAQPWLELVYRTLKELSDPVLQAAANQALATVLSKIMYGCLIIFFGAAGINQGNRLKAATGDNQWNWLVAVGFGGLVAGCLVIAAWAPQLLALEWMAIETIINLVKAQ